MVSGGSTIVAAKEQASSGLDGEVVILNLNSGVYYSLEAVGVDIWNLIQEPRTINEIRDAILTNYEIEPAQCERDLLTFLEELEAEGLIEASNESTAEVPKP
jgi:hypothetical protein